MQKYAGFHSEAEYDAQIDSDFISEAKVSIDDRERSECREILADLDKAFATYGSSLDSLLAHYKELFPEEFG